MSDRTHLYVDQSVKGDQIGIGYVIWEGDTREDLGMSAFKTELLGVDLTGESWVPEVAAVAVGTSALLLHDRGPTTIYVDNQRTLRLLRKERDHRRTADGFQKVKPLLSRIEFAEDRIGITNRSYQYLDNRASAGNPADRLATRARTTNGSNATPPHLRTYPDQESRGPKTPKPEWKPEHALEDPRPTHPCPVCGDWTYGADGDQRCKVCRETGEAITPDEESGVSTCEDCWRDTTDGDDYCEYHPL